MSSTWWATQWILWLSCFGWFLQLWQQDPLLFRKTWCGFQEPWLWAFMAYYQLCKFGFQPCLATTARSFGTECAKLHPAPSSKKSLHLCLLQGSRKAAQHVMQGVNVKISLRLQVFWEISLSWVPSGVRIGLRTGLLTGLGQKLRFTFLILILYLISLGTIKIFNHVKE